MTGRKRKPGRRYPSGDITIEVPPTQTAMEARMRLYRLSKAAALTQEAGTAIGRALRNGELSRTQHAALIEWQVRYEQWMRATDSRRPRSASDFSGAGGYDGREGDEPDYVAKCETAKRRYQEVRRAVLECGDPLAHLALQIWLQDDTEDYALIGTLRCAANALARVLDTPRKSQ